MSDTVNRENPSTGYHERYLRRLSGSRLKNQGDANLTACTTLQNKNKDREK
jgi:hypothetical protein